MFAGVQLKTARLEQGVVVMWWVFKRATLSLKNLFGRVCTLHPEETVNFHLLFPAPFVFLGQQTADVFCAA